MISEYYGFIADIGLEAKRKSFNDMEEQYKDWTRLRDDETTQMLNIVLKRYKDLETKEQDEQSAIHLWKQNTTATQRRQTGAPESLKLLGRERFLVVEQTVADLKSALGEEAFGKLNKFVLRSLDSDKNQESKHVPPPGFVDPATLLPGPDATRVKK